MSVDISPATALAQLALRAPGTASLVDESRTVTAVEVHTATGRLAGRLARGGVGAGDRVAYAGRNSPATLITLLACAHLGSVFVPLNSRLTCGEVHDLLAHSGARSVVVDSELAGLCADLAPGLAVTQWVTAEDVLAGASTEPADIDQAEAPPRRPCGFEDLALIMYTSGTSGRPKGVMLTHGNLWWSQRNIDEVFDTRVDDVTLAVAPLFHIGGLNAFALRTLVRGGTVLVRRTFDAQRTLDDLLGGVTSVFGVPAMYAAVARLPGFAAADLSGVRAAIVAGAGVPPLLVTTYADHGMALQQSWGMTETAPACTFVPAARVRDKAGSAGLELPHTRIRLHDPATGDEVTTPGLTGEIHVAGPQVTPGYWRDQATTDAVIDPAGWLRTGDLASRDADGYLTIVGRLTEVINTGGEKVHPSEVEDALVGMPGVAEVVVVGVPHPGWGETVVAVLVAGPVEAPVPSLDEVREHAGRSIARYKLPTRVLHLPALPLNGAGKVDRARIRSLAVDDAAVLDG